MRFLQASRLSPALASMLLLFVPHRAPGDAAPATSGAAFRVPVGDVVLDIEDPQVDQKMGGAFVLGMRSGATNCLIASLWKEPNQAGAIAFVVKPPPGEGRYLVSLQSGKTISKELAACVQGLFDDFYRYKNKLAFDRLEGTLHFNPRFVDAPAPPADAELRAILDRKYARTAAVSVVKATQTYLSHDADGSTGIFRRYRYDVELEFTTDGYETTCQHFGPYKVFGTGPYTSPGAGHTCTSTPRRRGEHVRDDAAIDFRLELYPEIAKTWELRSGDR